MEPIPPPPLPYTIRQQIKKFIVDDDDANNMVKKIRRYLYSIFDTIDTFELTVIDDGVCFYIMTCTHFPEIYYRMMAKILYSCTAEQIDRIKMIEYDTTTDNLILYIIKLPYLKTIEVDVSVDETIFPTRTTPIPKLVTRKPTETVVAFQNRLASYHCFYTKGVYNHDGRYLAPQRCNASDCAFLFEIIVAHVLCAVEERSYVSYTVLPYIENNTINTDVHIIGISGIKRFSSTMFRFLSQQFGDARHAIDDNYTIIRAINPQDIEMKFDTTKNIFYLKVHTSAIMSCTQLEQFIRTIVLQNNYVCLFANDIFPLGKTLQWLYIYIYFVFSLIFF